MHGAITWQALAGVFLIITGLVALGGGILGFVAGASSDAIAAGNDSASAGIKAALLGAIFIGAGIWLVS